MPQEYLKPTIIPMQYRKQQLPAIIRSSTKSKETENNRSNSHISYDPLVETIDTQQYTYLHNYAYQQYIMGNYNVTLQICYQLYEYDACRTDNLLLLGATHFQLGNYSECLFYNQQCIQVDNNFAEAYGNLGNALREIGDIMGAIQYYLKAIKIHPQFSDAYNNLANAYLQIGRTNEAIETYKLALLLDPSHVDAYSNLGNLYKIRGMYPQAQSCYTEAIHIRPTFAIAWSNLAGILKDNGKLSEAISHYQEAIRLAPDFADAYSNLGNALKECGRVAEAIEAYKKAISIRPEFAVAYGNLASSYYDVGNLEVAVQTFRRAIQLEPNFPDAYNNLGNALRELAQTEEAISCYRTALRLKPDHPHAYNNLGNALKDKGMVKEAIQCYATAVRLMPGFAAGHSNLGSVLKEQGKYSQALAHYQQAITLDPTFADAFSNMGNVYKDLGRVNEAISCYSTAISLKPAFPDAYNNLASTYKENGRLDEAITCYKKALSLRPNFPDAFANYFHSMMFICNWSSRDIDIQTLFRYLDAQLAVENILPSVQPFHALVYPLSMSRFHEICKRYARRAQLNVSLVNLPGLHHYKRKQPNDRIRVGYVSSDFGNHPLAHLMQSVFGFHDPSRFHVFCYATTISDGSKWRQKIQSEAETFREIGSLSNADAAQLIHNDDIHILVNLNGYTKGARNEIFALHPAPVQMGFMGFCGTLGAGYVEYMVGDGVVVPPQLRQYYSEKILVLPHSYFVNDHKQSARDVLDITKCPTRADYNIPTDKFVFCNFNQVYKIDPNTFTTWMNILKRVPNSILWLLRFPPSAEKHILTEAVRRGVPASRIHFTNVAPKDEHLRRGYLGDIFLDTPACNAHTTGCDILWGGTPMITMTGERMVSRVASSLLMAVNLPELITNNLSQYEELAVSLASDQNKLLSIRRRLEDSRDDCPLFDTQRWVQNLETGYELAWDLHEAGLPPKHITIPDIRVKEEKKKQCETISTLTEALISKETRI